MGFTGDKNEPGGELLSKVTATISIDSSKLNKGEKVKVRGNPSATEEQIKYAEAKAQDMGYTLTGRSGNFELEKS